MKNFVLLIFIFCMSPFARSEQPLQKELYQKYIQDLSKENFSKNNIIKKKEENNIYYLISFSMRDEAINEIMEMSSYYNIPVYINGLINNSMRETTSKFINLFGKNSKYGIAIDPQLFTKYNVKSVPALIVVCDSNYDKVLGNIPINQALNKVLENGDCSKVIGKLLGNKQ